MLYVKNAVQLEFLLNYKYSFRTSQETHHVSVIQTNRLMLFRETVLVCCKTKKHNSKQANVLCGQNAVLVRQNKWYILWHVDLLLGSYGEIRKYTAAVANNCSAKQAYSYKI
jgi:hypothetical protein